MITVYASSAFVIIELVNNISEPLNLPERLSTIVILVLAIGFPVAILLSWIFDLGPGGMEKTKPMGEDEAGESAFVTNRWKIISYISIVVIIGLLVVNVMGRPGPGSAGDIQKVLIWPGWEWEKAEKEFRRSLELNPNDALCRSYYAHLLMILRRTDEAMEQVTLALELDPMRSLVLGLNAVVINHTGDFSRALDYYEQAYEKHAGTLGYISGDYLIWPELKDDPRYIAILEKMGLPLPGEER